MEKFKKIRKIGRGTYGDVLLVQNINDGSLVALKKVVLENLQSSSSSGGQITQRFGEQEDKTNVKSIAKSVRTQIQTEMPNISHQASVDDSKHKKIMFP